MNKGNRADKWDVNTEVSPSIGYIARMSDEELLEEEFNAFIAGMDDYVAELNEAMQARGLTSYHDSNS